MRYGYFDNDRWEYVIDRVDVPVPWTNYIGLKDFYGVFDHTAAGYVLYRSSEYHSISRFRPNGPMEGPGHVEYILNLYTKRWPVEVFFRTTKGKLALDKYQSRSATGIRRFWLLMSLTYFLCCVGSGVLRSFSEGYEYWQKLVLRNVVQYVYNCGKNGMPFAMLGLG